MSETTNRLQAGIDRIAEAPLHLAYEDQPKGEAFKTCHNCWNPVPARILDETNTCSDCRGEGHASAAIDHHYPKNRG